MTRLFRSSRLRAVLLAAIFAWTTVFAPTGIDATHTSASVRSYVVDESGSVVRMTIASGEPGAGTYVPLWNGHGDAVALQKLDPATGTLTLANSYRYETFGRPTTTMSSASVCCRG